MIHSLGRRNRACLSTVVCFGCFTCSSDDVQVFDSDTGGVVDVAGVADDALAGEILASEREMRVLMARQLALIGKADHRRVCIRDGARNTKAWLQSLLNLAPGEAYTRVAVAEGVEGQPTLTGPPLEPDLPATAAGLAGGGISLAHAKVIRDGVRNLPLSATPEQRSGAEEFLAAQAHQLPPQQVRVLADRIRYQLDQDGALRDERQQYEDRFVHISTAPNGMTSVTALLTKESGAKLRTVLEPLAAPRPAEDGERDPRTAGQRNADALDVVLDRSLSGEWLPRAGGARPQIAVLSSYQTLHDQTSGKAGAPPAILAATGETITPDTVRRIACDAEILPIVLGGDNQPLNVGRTRRTAPPHIRSALLARDGTCAFPGCDHPPGTSEAHHCVLWTDGGETSVTNMIMLCGHHHRAIHHEGWTAQVTPDGIPEFTPPMWIDLDRRPRRAAPPIHHHQTPALQPPEPALLQ